MTKTNLMINIKHIYNNKLNSSSIVALFIGLVAIASIIEASYLTTILVDKIDLGTLLILVPLIAALIIVLNTNASSILAFSTVLISFTALKPLNQLINCINLDSVNYFFTDGASSWLVWLVTLVGYVVLLGSNADKDKFKHTMYSKSFNALSSISLGIIFSSVIVCFITKNIFLFFIFFELILLPLIVIISTQGSRGNRLVAIKYLACYTLVGSVFLWLPVVYMVEIVGSTDFDSLHYLIALHTSSGLRKVLFLSLLIGFCFKVPVVPVHQWLIIAHVEAPTSGSIVLAALLLKIGGYGIYRFCFTLFPIESFTYSNVIIAVSLFGYTYATLLAIRQVDVKRFIAYTSISHMNYSLMGLFSGSEMGILGFFHTMISHGVIATAMFYLIGHLYSVLGYRDSIRVSGLAETLPVFSFFWFIFSVANMGLPLFSAFPGELFIMVSLTEMCTILPLFTFVGFFFTGLYTFLQINKMLFSTYRGSFLSFSINSISDLSSRNIATLSILLIITVLIGLCPDIITCSLEY